MIIASEIASEIKSKSDIPHDNSWRYRGKISLKREREIVLPRKLTEKMRVHAKRGTDSTMTHRENGRNLDKSTETSVLPRERTARDLFVRTKNRSSRLQRNLRGVFRRTRKLEKRSGTKCVFLAIRRQGRRMTRAFSRYRENSVMHIRHAYDISKFPWSLVTYPRTFRFLNLLLLKRKLKRRKNTLFGRCIKIKNLMEMRDNRKNLFFFV